MTVDHNRRNLELLGQVLQREGYRTIAAASQEEFLQAVEQGEDISLALVDLDGFGKGIWDCCESLRVARIPFLVISPKQSTAIMQEGLSRGASSVLVKPLVINELLALIRSLLPE